MPELPDVETFRRYLDRTALHETIDEVEVTTSKVLDHVSGKRLRAALRGRRLDETRRHGKWLLARAGDQWLALHFGMTGYLRYYQEDGAEPGAHERVRLHLASGHALAYDCQRLFGRVGLTRDPDAFVTGKDLGPDALSLSREQFLELLETHRGGIKSLLMNQKHIAGIGNVYSDEILYRAGIHPDAAVADLDEGTRKQLYRSLRGVLEKTIEKQADPERFPKSYLTPHRKKGERCPRCGARLVRKQSAGRSAWLCPGHQGKGR